VIARTVSYSVDHVDRIRWVNENWDRFAVDNDAPHLTGAAVIGTKLWSYVSDLTLQYLLQKIFVRARASRQPTMLTCRCDGPTVRRELEVCLESRDGATVLITSTVISEVPRPIPYVLSGAQGLLRVCSWCNSVAMGGQWVELEDAVHQLGLLKGPHHPAITHTLCPRCEESLKTAGEL
jgi:hypothetical protein